MGVRFQRCHHCGELIGLSAYYITVPDGQPNVRWFWHQECLEAEAEPAPPIANAERARVRICEALGLDPATADFSLIDWKGMQRFRAANGISARLFGLLEGGVH